MNIRSTNLSNSTSISRPAFQDSPKPSETESAPKESFSFGFERDPDVYMKAAVATIGGAIAGASAEGAWAIPANIGITAGLGLVSGAGVELTGGDAGMLNGLALISETVAGAASGAVGGIVGYGLSAVTGINPSITGAVAGGAFALMAYR